MRCAAISLCLAAISCGGGTSSTSTSPETTDPPAVEPPPESRPPAPVRVALGQCTEKKVPFVSGSFARYASQGDAFASLTGTGLSRPPEITLGSASATNGLDKNIIRRYVRRKLPRVRSCYERELLRRPNLAGTVVVKFAIEASGAVTGVRASGLGSVRGCVARAIETIRFPQPKSGGRVDVRYPFVFKPAAAATFGLGATAPAVRVGKPTSSAGLDKNIIRRYVRRKLARIRTCYERELAKKPTLAGVVTVRFAIDPSGRVSGVKTSGFHSKVDACVAAAIRSIRFPKPVGGKRVQVSYPFVFSASTASRGGGGTGWGTIGIGKLGKIGHGSGKGTGYGTGSGSMKRRGTTSVRLGQSSSAGSLDKNIIRRIIRSHIASIKRCYERQLLVDPGLAGKVVARFTIGANGDVVASSASGLHPNVDSCVTRVIRRMRFPKPKGGGVVKVSYPFIFRGSGTGGATATSSGKPGGSDDAMQTARRAGVLGALVAGVERVDSPLGDHREAIETCAREHLSLAARHDALVVDLGGDEPEVRSSGQNRALERCLAEALASVKADQMRCPLAVGTAQVAGAPQLRIGAATLSFGGKPLVDGEALRRALRDYRDSVVAPGFEPPVATLGPIVLVVEPDVEFRRIAAVLEVADRLELAVAVASGPDTLLRPAPLPWVPVPAARVVAPPGEALRLEVGDDVAIDGEGPPARVSIGQLSGAVSGMRASQTFGDRPVVAVADDVPFSRVAAVLAELAKAGFTDWHLSSR
jgi:TonB family protein